MEINSVKYIPAWNGNRDSDKPFTVCLLPMTRGDVEQYAGMIHSEPVRGFRNRSKSNAVSIQKKQFFDHVETINNFKHPRLGHAIKTAKELYEAPGMNELIEELIEAIEKESVLSEGLAKN